MSWIDLRSDTVTRPTPEMREAMARAEVGDDVYGEDPTVNRLEELAAQKMGMQAGIFLPSGTMGNLTAVLAHCERGDEVLMGNLAHTFLMEGGGISALGGIFAHTIENQPDGTLRLEDISSSIRPDDVHQPITRLVILENTHNRRGGVVLSEQYTRAVGDLAHKRGMRLHLDGARIFNAATALNIPVKRLTIPADSVTFCLSKGLCAPAGSVLCGSHSFVAKARRIRKMLGGGMRQVGILAAAGIIAIEKMTERLGEDHSRAQWLAEGLIRLPGIVFEMGTPQTNMVFPSLAPDFPLTAGDMASRLQSWGIKVGVVGTRRFRLVTHYWIDDSAIARTIEAFKANLI